MSLNLSFSRRPIQQCIFINHPIWTGKVFHRRIGILFLIRKPFITTIVDVEGLQYIRIALHRRPHCSKMIKQDKCVACIEL